MPDTKKPYPGPINDTDKQTLHGAGVDVSDTPLRSEEDETSKEEAVVDIDSATPAVADSDVVSTGIRFIKSETPVNKEDLSSLAEASMKKSSKDLEEEFRSELGETKPVSKKTSQKEILGKSESLSELLTRIEAKLTNKKTEVKSELDSLKKMKDTISKDITEIKDLEASEEKIKAEIEKIESIREEVEDIEEELNDKI